ncbi:hypothetical protein [Acinetobacter sp. AS5]|uniref:hypothetical protein n=1 Tax=Acinetobacter sp. AS5 TaxID=3029187 RepID=UPI003B7CD1EF
MSNNNFQQLLLDMRNFLQPIADKFEEIQKNPETSKFIQNVDYLVKSHERTSPFMKKLLSKMEGNSNLSEALETIPYRQIFRLLANSEQIESVSILHLINDDLFQMGILECFDEIQIGNHFKRRKQLIAEAFKLYELEYFSGCLCLIHSQLEGIITDYLIFKNIIRKEIASGKTKFICNSDGKNVVGLAKKIELAKDINENFLRLESFQFDNDQNKKFHNERNDLLHGSNIDNFNAERCFIVFIWIDSILGSIYRNEVILN